MQVAVQTASLIDNSVQKIGPLLNKLLFQVTAIANELLLLLCVSRAMFPAI